MATQLAQSQSGSMVNIVNAMVMVLGIIFAGLLGYWVSDRDPPASLVDVEIITPVVHENGVVKVIYKLDRSRYCRVRVEQVLYDSENIRFPASDLDFAIDPGRQKLGVDKIGMAVQLPSWFAKGPAIHRAVRAYYCNPLQKFLDWPVLLIGPNTEFVVE